MRPLEKKHQIEATNKGTVKWVTFKTEKESKIGWILSLLVTSNTQTRGKTLHFVLL
jgi:hypothetical protein